MVKPYFLEHFHENNLLMSKSAGKMKIGRNKDFKIVIRLGRPALESEDTIEE